MWSTTSCNVYVALLRDMGGNVLRMTSEIRQDIKEFKRWLEKKAAFIFDLLGGRKSLHDLFKVAKEKISYMTTRFWYTTRKFTDNSGDSFWQSKPFSNSGSSNDSSSSSSNSGESFSGSDRTSRAKMRESRRRAEKQT